MKKEHTENAGQKTVSGKDQHGPDDKVGRDAGGNKGSKGQNTRGHDPDRHRPGKQSRDEGDERGPHGGSGGGQKNRQNRAVNRGSKVGGG